MGWHDLSRIRTLVTFSKNKQVIRLLGTPGILTRPDTFTSKRILPLHFLNNFLPFLMLFIHCLTFWRDSLCKRIWLSWCIRMPQEQSLPLTTAALKSLTGPWGLKAEGVHSYLRHLPAEQTRHCQRYEGNR